MIVTVRSRIHVCPKTCGASHGRLSTVQQAPVGQVAFPTTRGASERRQASQARPLIEAHLCHARRTRGRHCGADLPGPGWPAWQSIRAQDTGLQGLRLPVREDALLDAEFADDTAAYLHGHEANIIKFWLALDHFCDASGAKINWHKSYGFWVGEGEHLAWLSSAQL